MSELPTDYLRDLLKSILSAEGFDPECKYYIKENNLRLWVSSVHRVRVYKNEPEKDEDQLALFFKCLPENPDIRETFDIEFVFRNEIDFYNGVMDPFLNFQKKKNVKNPFCAVPKCYKAISDGVNDVLVLEDLEPKEYVMLDRLKLMGLPELYITMKELGRFHALSLAMKDQEPENFAKVRTAVQEIVFCNRFLNKFGKLYDYVVKDTINLVKQNFSEDSAYVTKLIKYDGIIRDKMIELARPKEEDEPCNVITHADLWVNNFLFHYSEDTAGNKTPDDMKLLDFQGCRYASLALDVSYFLLSSTDKAMRMEHQDSLLQTYYKNLCELLVQLGSDPENILSYEVLKFQVKKYSEYALWKTLFNVPHTLDEGVSIEANNTSSDSVTEKDDTMTALTGAYKRKTKRCEERLLDVIKFVIDEWWL